MQKKYDHITRCLSKLQVAHVLGEPVGFGTGGGTCGDGPGGPLPWNLYCSPKQVDLLPVNILHVILQLRKNDKRVTATALKTLDEKCLVNSI